MEDNNNVLGAEILLLIRPKMTLKHLLQLERNFFLSYFFFLSQRVQKIGNDDRTLKTLPHRYRRSGINTKNSKTL